MVHWSPWIVVFRVLYAAPRLHFCHYGAPVNYPRHDACRDRYRSPGCPVKCALGVSSARWLSLTTGFLSCGRRSRWSTVFACGTRTHPSWGRRKCKLQDSFRWWS
ncbi:hypothetical protein DFH06DRAFT_210322 [Mycena polygramma]|nr:hypothetical protein DFH06DRAFT_210322 [Mycena polygramma]